MTQPVAFVLQAKTRPSHSSAFKAFFHQHLAASRREPGCLQYHMLQDAADPTLFVFFEVWASQQALDVHANLPHMRAFMARKAEYLEADFVIQAVQPL
ncbi:antibiotic biosynthesis monooxygenase [Pseudomonas sp. NPDC007930]|uniref:putative quinol monooxygenase n=1 Tax=Pseudomonas sp. NPDC007930 TaxID=3364417 RepID=UPI0036E1736A